MWAIIAVLVCLQSSISLASMPFRSARIQPLCFPELACCSRLLGPRMDRKKLVRLLIDQVRFDPLSGCRMRAEDLQLCLPEDDLLVASGVDGCRRSHEQWDGRGCLFTLVLNKRTGLLMVIGRGGHTPTVCPKQSLDLALMVSLIYRDVSHGGIVVSMQGRYAQILGMHSLYHLAMIDPAWAEDERLFFVEDTPGDLTT